MLRTVLTLICLLLARTAVAAPLPDFEANYVLSLGSLRIGTSSISLENRADGTYLYESRSTPTRLVSWLFKDRLHETSRGTLSEAGVRPDEYHYERTGNKERTANLTFDWQAMRVSNHVEDSHWEMDIPAGTLDKLASQLAMMLALQHGETDVTLQIADGGKLKKYRFRVVGKETLELPAGRFETVKITKVRSNNRRETYIWCAPALNYLPVRIWQREQDESEYQSELEAFSESLRVTAAAATP